MKLKKGRSHLLLKSVLLTAILFGFSSDGRAEEQGRFYDIGIGIGTDLFAWLDTRQVLIAPAMNWKMDGLKGTLLRLEGDIEVIDDFKRPIIIVGVAPMLRFFFHENGNRPKPFIEAGGGGNVVNWNKANGRELGGGFAFSGMAGAGLEFRAWDTGIGISYRYRHLSNARLYPENDSFNSHYLMLSIGLQ